MNIPLVVAYLLALATSPASGLSLGGLAGVVGKNQTFDYAIVGAGTAGLPLAYRLSENPNVTVAVIEAGKFYQISNPYLSSTPAGDVVFCGSSPLDNNPFVDWNFITQPQTSAGNRQVHYARGRCLGGTSARNFMIYQRGTVGSFQQWANNVNDQSYTFENLLPYFQKSMQFTPPNTSKRAPNATAAYDPSAFSPAGGPGKVSYANYAQTFSSWMEGGLNAIGIPQRKNGFNDGALIGTAYCSSTIDPSNENRASSQETFLSAAMAEGRTNLKVFQLSTAKKILFNSSKTATGVQVATAGVLPYILSASSEVIVAAGAFQSPQLLMVSGIGPADQLSAQNIPIIYENPNVGQGMQDHIFAGPTYQVSLETFTKLANDPAYLAAEFAQYRLTQTGPVTSPVADFLGWEKVPASLRSQFTNSTQAILAEYPADWPEIEYISGAGYVGNFADLLTTQPGKVTGQQYATILSTLVAPQSRGNVSIVSADTSVLPKINPNWLSSPVDQQVAVAAFKRARQAFATPFMQKVVVGQEYFPGPSVQTDAQILENYQNTLMTVWHASCTCKMGSGPNDPTAVVDPQARVIGVQNLRVVDASAFNLLPPGHPQSMIYALAEKIAADIQTTNQK